MATQNEIISVCIPVKNYVREAAVMLCSLYENTTSKVDTYIISEGLKEESETRLKEIADKYKQNIFFKTIKIDEDEVKEIVKNNKLGYDSGVLYRLKVADALPESVERVITVGTDLIFNLDINELWNTDMGSYAIMGVKDASVGRGMEKYLDNFGDCFDSENHINSDVILMDLAKIRNKYSLWKASVEFLSSNFEIAYMDQDAINYVFKGDVGLLDERYNSLTIYLPEGNQERIYHFAGDHILWKNDFARQKFFDYLAKTPWCEDGPAILMRWIQDFEKRIDYYKRIIKSTENKKKCFWGIGGTWFEELMEYFSLNEEDIFVDANPEKWGRESHTKQIQSPSILKDRDDVVVIVLIYDYARVADELRKLGLQEDKDFFEGRKLLQNYEERRV